MELGEGRLIEIPYDWFDSWHDTLVEVRLKFFSLPELREMRKSFSVQMRTTVIVQATLAAHLSPDFDIEDLFLDVGLRMNEGWFESFLDCGFGRGQEKFVATARVKHLPSCAAFNSAFSSFFERSLQDLRTTTSWIESTERGPHVA
jgi:hypothetical protein